MLENSGEHRAHGEHGILYLVGLHLKFVLKNSGEHRVATWRTGQYGILSWIISNLKFVLENSGEHRAHGEQENVEYYLVGLHLKTVYAGTVENTEHIKYRRTWNI